MVNINRLFTGLMSRAGMAVGSKGAKGVMMFSKEVSPVLVKACQVTIIWRDEEQWLAAGILGRGAMRFFLEVKMQRVH
jgi:hypothetical protein